MVVAGDQSRTGAAGDKDDGRGVDCGGPRLDCEHKENDEDEVVLAPEMKQMPRKSINEGGVGLTGSLGVGADGHRGDREFTFPCMERITDVI
jgi:hypothetical protein